MFNSNNSFADNLFQLLDLLLALASLAVILILGVVLFFDMLPAKIDTAFPVLPTILWLNVLVKTVVFFVAFEVLSKFIKLLINNSILKNLIPDNEQ